MIWITADDVIQIHSRVIQRSGGMDGQFPFLLKSSVFPTPDFELSPNYPQGKFEANTNLRKKLEKSRISYRNPG